MCRRVWPPAAFVLALAGCRSLQAGRFEPPATVPDLSRWVDVAGLRTHCYDTGPVPGGRTLVLLHGWAGSAYPFRELARLLVPTIRVLVPDLPGHGLSDFPPDRVTLDSLVVFVRELARASGLERFSLAGSSMGANIALHYAVRYPDEVTHLVLLSPVALPHQSGVPYFLLRSRAAVSAALAAAGRATVWRMLRRAARGGADRISADIVDAYLANLADGSHRRVFVDVTTGVVGSTFADGVLPTLRQPVLLVAGADDRLLAPEQVRRYRELAPGARVVILEGCGHFLQLQEPATLASVVSSFLVAAR